MREGWGEQEGGHGPLILAFIIHILWVLYNVTPGTSATVGRWQVSWTRDEEPHLTATSTNTSTFLWASLPPGSPVSQLPGPPGIGVSLEVDTDGLAHTHGVGVWGELLLSSWSHWSWAAASREAPHSFRGPFLPPRFL